MVQYFYCANDHCVDWKGSNRKSIENCAQEFKGKKLCKECYKDGYRLKIGVVCIRKPQIKGDR